MARFSAEYLSVHFLFTFVFDLFLILFFCRVKLAIDLSTRKQVAIKIMRVKNIINKKECLECLFTEINILTECRHPNVVKILDASFDGTIVKEQLMKQGLLKKEEPAQIAEQQEKKSHGSNRSYERDDFLNDPSQ